ncbi:MAG TPA: VCBS repeat-containing protein, partial [Candidatus Manganitrophaceae bacterium]
LNSDGRLDLAAANQSANQVTILIGNVSGGFDPLSAAIPVGNGPSSINVGEFNGDSRVDLVVANKLDNTILLLFGNGDATFTLSAPVPFPGPERLLVADADRNGLLDLLVAGPTVGSLLGSEEPAQGIAVEARNLNGERVGSVYYLDASGQVLPGAASTASNGAFIILNVPVGPDPIVLVRAVSGAAGSALIDVFEDGVSYIKLRTISLQPFVVSVQGVTYDPVGPPPAGVPIGSVNIQLLGMDIQTQSSASGDYSFNVDANSEYIVKLFFDIPSR